jgi:hypothetical protein
MVKMRKLKVWANTTDSTPPLFIKVPVPSQESDRSCICVLDLPLLTLLLDYRTVLTVWYLLLDYRTVLTVWDLLLDYRTVLTL